MPHEYRPPKYRQKKRKPEHKKTERKEKELILDLPKEETLIRKKFKNKGRMFQLKIENVDNSKFTLVAPELHCELDED